MRYFEILNAADLHVEERWHLGSAVSTISNEPIYCWPLVSGQPIAPNEFKAIDFPIQYDGPRLTFTFASWIGVPVVHRSIADIVAAKGGRSVKLLPCLIGGRDLEVFVLAVEKLIACLNVEGSEVTYYTREDFDDASDLQVEKIGTVKDIRVLKVDKTKLGEDDHIFRLAESPMRLIISEELKNALLDQTISGVTFAEV